MVLIEVIVLPEYIHVIRSNNGPELVEECREVENRVIPGRSYG
jgi:hypothetical protein